MGSHRVFAFLSARALTQKQTLLELVRVPSSLYFSDCNVELPLSPSARAAPPSEPSMFSERLRAWEQGRVLRALSMGADRGLGLRL